MACVTSLPRDSGVPHISIVFLCDGNVFSPSGSPQAVADADYIIGNLVRGGLLSMQYVCVCESVPPQPLQRSGYTESGRMLALGPERRVQKKPSIHPQSTCREVIKGEEKQTYTQRLSFRWSNLDH